MARRFLEILAYGTVVAFAFGAWDVRLHHDIAAGMFWLGADRVRVFLPQGLGLGLTLGALCLLVPLVLERTRPAGQRVGAAIGVLAAGGAAWHSSKPFLHEAKDRLYWNRHLLSAAVVVVLVSAAAILVWFWIIDRRRRIGGGAAPLAPARTAAAAAIVLGGLLWQSALPWAMERRVGDRPSVVMISLDTLRGDRLGFMGYPRPTSPLLDRFAREGTVFEQATAAAPWTLPSHVSLFTGMLPYDHGILHVGQRVRPELLLLAERFRDAGYRTAAFTGGGYVSWGYGFDQGFQRFEDHDEMREGGPEIIARRAREWVRARAGEPFFLFVHSYEPHGPYTHADFANPADRGRLPEGRSEPPGHVLSDPTPAERRYIADLYDGDVLHADRVLGGLIRDLHDSGLLDHAIVVVTSDHGEDLWDHTTGDIPAHGHSLYEEVLQVPLLFWGPGRIPSGCRISRPVSQLDVATTLLDLAEVGEDPRFPGRSLGKEVASCAEPGLVPVSAEGIRYGDERFSRREGEIKVIAEPTPPTGPAGRFGSVRSVEIYDLSSDPRERASRAGGASPRDREVLEEVLRRIRSSRRGGDQEPTRPLSEELQEQLRSLGYVR